MELLEFLSGKYKDGKRIVPGAVQTFQAKEASGGRPVFVHRVPTTGPDAQNGLVRLLSSALLRSEGVRKLVIEVADENGFCYIVTENAEQCLLLREWLQFEVERAGQPQPAGPAPTAPAQPAPTAPSASEQLTTPPAEPPGQKVPGEFSRLFHVPPQPTPAAAPPPAAAAPPRGNTGEFTRFFRGDALPSQKPAAPAQRADRPSSSEGIRAPRLSGAVQRPPNAPATQLPQRSSSDSGEMKPFLGDVRRAPDSTGEFKHSASGEFARLFSAPEKTSPRLPQPPSANTGFNAMPAAKQEPGEYTRIFGTGNAGSPFSAPAPPPQETPEKLFEGAPLPSAGEALPRGPSEYTQIIGRSPFNPLASAADAPAAAPPAEAPAPVPAAPPPMQVKLPPAPAMPAVPKIMLPKPSAVTVAAPAATNQRLVIFLAIVGLLAVALVIAVILLAKK